MAIARGFQNMASKPHVLVSADTAPGSTRTTTTTTYLDFSGRHWVDEAGGWIWCAPRRQRRAETCGGAQVPGKEGYAGCRFCGGGGHRAVDCPARWTASLGKLIAKGERIRGKAKVQEEVCEMVGSKKKEQKKEQKKESRRARRARGEGRRKKAQEDDVGRSAVNEMVQQAEDSRWAAAGSARKQAEDSRWAATERLEKETKTKAREEAKLREEEARAREEEKAREAKVKEARAQEEERDLELTRLREELEGTRAALREAHAALQGYQAQMQRLQMQQQERTAQQQVPFAQGTMERRQWWQDGGWYTQQQFVNMHGAEQGLYLWQRGTRGASRGM